MLTGCTLPLDLEDRPTSKLLQGLWISPYTRWLSACRVQASPSRRETAMAAMHDREKLTTPSLSFPWPRASLISNSSWLHFAGRAKHINLPHSSLIILTSGQWLRSWWPCSPDRLKHVVQLDQRVWAARYLCASRPTRHDLIFWPNGRPVPPWHWHNGHLVRLPDAVMHSLSMTDRKQRT